MKYLFFIIILISLGNFYANDWPMYMQNSYHYAQSSTSINQLTGSEFLFPTDKSILSSPIHKDNNIYFGSRDGYLYCVNSSGDLNWKYNAKGWIESTPLIDNGKIYFGTVEGKFFCLNSLNGSVNFSVDLESSVISSPNIENSSVFVATSYPNSKLYSLDTTTGNTNWTKSFSQPILTSPSIDNGKLVIADNTGKLYIISTSTGTDLFPSIETSSAYNFSSPLIYNGYAYFITQETAKKIYRIDLSNGTSNSVDIESSSYVFSHSSTPSTDGTNIYFMFGYPTTTVYAYSIATFTKVWSKTIGETLKMGKLSPPIISGTQIIATALNSDETSTIYSLNNTDGTENWNYNFSDIILSTPAVYDTKLLVTGYSGNLYMLSDSPTSIFKIVRTSIAQNTSVDTLKPEFSFYFTDSIDSLTAITSNIYFKDPNGNKISAEIKVSDQKLTIKPLSYLTEAQSYNIIIEDGLMSENSVHLDGNSDGIEYGDYSYTFFTTGFSKGEITSFSPAKNSTDIEVNSVVSFKLSKSLNSEQTFSDAIKIRKYSETGDEISGTFSYDETNSTLTFTPDYPFAYNSNYYVSIENLEDNLENYFNNYSYYFSTKGTTTLSYNIDYKRGINIVCPPVIPNSDFKAKDLINILNADYIIGFDAKNSQNVICYANSNEDNNFKIECGFGYVAFLKEDKTISWSGYIENNEINYPKGLIIAGLPGNYNENYTAKSFCELLEVNSLIYYDNNEQKFKTFVYDGTNDFDLKIGFGYIVNLLKETTIYLTGGEYSVKTTKKSDVATESSSTTEILKFYSTSNSSTKDDYIITAEYENTPQILSTYSLDNTEISYLYNKGTSEASILENLRSNIYNTFIIEKQTTDLEDLSYYKELREKINSGDILICGPLTFNSNEIFDFSSPTSQVNIENAVVTTDTTKLTDYSITENITLYEISAGSGDVIANADNYPLIYLVKYGNGYIFYFTEKLSEIPNNEFKIYIDAIFDKYFNFDKPAPFEASNVITANFNITNRSSKDKELKIKLISENNCYFINKDNLDILKQTDSKEISIIDKDSSTISMLFKLPKNSSSGLIDIEVLEKDNDFYSYLFTDYQYKDNICEDPDLSDRLTELIYTLSYSGFSDEASKLEEIQNSSLFQTKDEIKTNIDKLVDIIENIKNTDQSLRLKLQPILDIYQTEYFWFSKQEQ